jgi:SAM-dependent methyltransferase
VSSQRPFSGEEFERAYQKVVLGNTFFEDPEYYHLQKGRYQRTLELLAELPVPRPARLLEVGGGQIALLCREMFGDDTVVADVNANWASGAVAQQVGFVECDLLHDDLPAEQAGTYDLVVACEVVEHLPVPLHGVLKKMRAWIRPGGRLFLTTPNLYRLRNVFRLMTGKPLFCPLFYPERGQPIGHPLEFSSDNLRWQIEQSGFQLESLKLEQLGFVGGHRLSILARMAAAPLLAVRPVLREQIVAVAVK